MMKKLRRRLALCLPLLLAALIGAAGLFYTAHAAANAYTDLGVRANSSAKKIDRVWRSLVGSYHPDKHSYSQRNLTVKEMTAIFSLLNQVETLENLQKRELPPWLEPYRTLKKQYYILKDPKMRAEYDEWLKNPQPQGFAQAPGQGEKSGLPAKTDPKRPFIAKYNPHVMGSYNGRPVLQAYALNQHQPEASSFELEPGEKMSKAYSAPGRIDSLYAVLGLEHTASFERIDESFQEIVKWLESDIRKAEQTRATRHHKENLLQEANRKRKYLAQLLSPEIGSPLIAKAQKSPPSPYTHARTAYLTLSDPEARARYDLRHDYWRHVVYRSRIDVKKPQEFATEKEADNRIIGFGAFGAALGAVGSLLFFADVPESNMYSQGGVSAAIAIAGGIAGACIGAFTGKPINPEDLNTRRGCPCGFH